MSANGWHQATLVGRDAIRSRRVAFLIRWRTQRHRCHYQTWRTWREEHGAYVDGTYGEPRGYVSQCGNCGSLQSFAFTFEPVDPPDLPQVDLSC